MFLFFCEDAMRHHLSCFFLLICSSVAVASEPIDVTTHVPNQLYQSPLKGYQPSAPGAVGSWQQANDVVREVGGWKVYLREAQAEDPKPTELNTAPKAAPIIVPPAPQVPVKPAAMHHHQHK
jgi:hypothetical protein